MFTSQIGNNLPPGHWLTRAAWLRNAVISDTANQFATVMPGILQPAVRLGVTKGLNALIPGGSRRHPQLYRELADSKSNLISERWAQQYSRKLGEVVGEASADGLLLNLANVQRQNWAQHVMWNVVHSAAGLPPGQTTSVFQVANNRLGTYFSTRKPMTPLDFGADVGQLLLSRRAKLIYHNESVVAQNFGTQLLLMNAVAKGYLPKDTRKVWVTAPDERVCPVCAPMDSVAVKLDEPFHIRAHTSVLNHDVMLWVPPAHPGCRCRIVPESAIEHGIITRTARWKRDEHGRAKLRSELADLVHNAAPSWMD